MEQDLNEPPKIPFLWINLNYKVNAELGRDVIVSGRKGTITKDMGTYIGVTWHDGNKKRSFPCHPTSEVIYLDTFTDLKKFKPSRSAQRYLDYLEADSCLTFKQYLGIKK
jgi:hypothetical protein